jgi:5'-methylthioadenosine phosphorylase
MVFTLGLIGGSGLLKSSLSAFAPSSLSEATVETSAGRVFLRRGVLRDGVRLVFVQRHDASASRVYAQPSDINYAAVALALKAEGCDAIVGAASVGSLHASLPVGALLVPDDWYCPADLRRVHADYRGHFMPALSAPLRAALLDALRAGPPAADGGAVAGAGLHPVPHGTYVNSCGPRFETRAEIRVMAAQGDVVGMTAAHEVRRGGARKARRARSHTHGAATACARSAPPSSPFCHPFRRRARAASSACRTLCCAWWTTLPTAWAASCRSKSSTRRRRPTASRSKLRCRRCSRACPRR